MASSTNHGGTQLAETVFAHRDQAHGLARVLDRKFLRQRTPDRVHLDARGVTPGGVEQADALERTGAPDRLRRRPSDAFGQAVYHEMMTRQHL